MGQSDRKHGQCRICGEHRQLSFEHVPPEAAFNNAPAVAYHLDEYLRTRGDWESMRGRKSQRGVGAHTLCIPCNSKTGGWYGGEYVEWAKRGLQILDHVPPGTPPFQMTATGRYPLRFIKQIVTMMFSVNSLGFAEANPELVTFVLDKERSHLPPKYQVYLTVVGGPRTRSSGITGILDLDQHHTELVTEVGFPPFASLLLIGQERRADLGRITHFFDCGYNEKREVTVRLQRGELATPYPNDYRTRERVEREAAAQMAAPSSL
jgi:hypothetical protein